LCCSYRWVVTPSDNSSCQTAKTGRPLSLHL
jgi:hypothetical protein